MKYIEVVDKENIDELNIKEILNIDGCEEIKTCITIGKFDGIHIGHKILIDKCVKSKNEGYVSIVFTFKQCKEQQYIYEEEEKRRLLKKMGIDVCIVCPFSDEIRNMSPRNFVQKVLIDKLCAKRIIVGEDFKFGKDRSGDVIYLGKICNEHSVETLIIEKKKDEENREVSSRRIREYISKSELNKVYTLLGRYIEINGFVEKGRQIGRTIGFPTININPNKGKVIPKNGVYKSFVIIEEEFYKDKRYIGMTNIGNNPTVGENLEKVIETHIINFSGDIYGKKVKIILLEYIREECRFESIEALKEQIRKDKSIIIA